MNEKEAQKFTPPEEKRFIRKNATLKQKEQRIHEKLNASEEKRVFWRLLESKVIAALLTVLIGGLLAQYISSSLQKRTQFQEQRLIEHRERLEAAREIVEASYKMVADIVAIVERLTALESSDVNEELSEVRAEFREKTAEWDSKKGYVGYLISYYYGGETRLLYTWNRTVSAVDSFISCHKSPDCEERLAVSDEQHQLLLLLVEAQQHSWKAISE